MENLLTAIFGKTYVLWAAKQKMKANMWKLESDICDMQNKIDLVRKDVEDQQGVVDSLTPHSTEQKQAEEALEGRKMVLQALKQGNPATGEPGILQLQKVHGNILIKLGKF